MTKEHLFCPFCGDRDIRFRFDTGGGWVAECGSCPCELRWFSTEDEARAAWNRRPVEPACKHERRSGWIDAQSGRGKDTCDVCGTVLWDNSDGLNPQQQSVTLNR